MKGTITRIAGPLIEASGMQGNKMQDIVYVGKEKLVGEIIKIKGDKASIQVYEETSGLIPGEEVTGSGSPLCVELGPGLIGSVYDGIQRPLPVLTKQTGDFIKRGTSANALDRSKKWEFKPKVKKGDLITGGSIIGTVMETKNIEHSILAPPGVKGTVKEVKDGTFTVEETVCVIEDNGIKRNLSMMHKWPVKVPRPIKNRIEVETPLLSGQRVLDTFFPIAKGGTSAIPGPFGAGKTVTQH